VEFFEPWAKSLGYPLVWGEVVESVAGPQE
jgi:hypothetical protein